MTSEDRQRPWTRPAQPGDLEAVVRLVALMHDEEPPDLDGSGPLDTIFSSLLTQPNRFLIVGGVDEDVAGSADMVVVPNISRGGRPWGVIENVVVDPPYRRQGIARALMADLLATAEALGCYKLQLVSARHRGEAHDLYRSLGFDADVAGFRKYLAMGPPPS